MTKINKSAATKLAKKTFAAALAGPLLLTFQPVQAVTLPEAPEAHVSAYENEVAQMAIFMQRADALETEARMSEVEQDLDAALASLEVSAEEIEVEEQLEEVAETPDAPVSFADAMRSFDEQAVLGMTQQITGAIDARVAYEIEKKGTGHNIQKTLTKVRKALMWRETSRVMLAAKVDPAFINRTLHDGSCYNVYAVDKVADAVKALAEGVVSNAINRACMVSLFQMRKAGLPFTGEVAKACASDKHHIDLAIRKHLLRHTVSASTAPTQASSTMQALETLGIVRRDGSSRNPTFTLTDSPITKRLEEVLFAHAA